MLNPENNATRNFVSADLKECVSSAKLATFHSDEKQERLRDKLRDELGPVIVGLLDKSSGIEDIIVNEDSRIWVKRTGYSFEQVGELSSRQARGAMMTIASMQKTTVTELRPVLETQLPISKFRFPGLIEPVVPSPSFAIRV